MSPFIIFCISLIFLWIFYLAYKARPAANQSGNAIISPETGWKTATTLCVGTYNIQSGKDIHGKRDLTRSAHVIRKCDMAGIQEVYAKTWLGGASQAQQLAHSNQMGWLFAATRRRWFREHRGNALLSRIAVKRWHVNMLPDSTGKQYRNLVTAFVELGDTEIAVLITHLHTKTGREQQLETVISAFNQHQYAILMGDLNTTPSDPLIQKLLEQADTQDAIQSAFPEHDHSQRIDWIITKNLQAAAADFAPIGISDHPFYSVHISL